MNKAVIIKKQGSVGVFKVKEFPIPKLGDDDILIRQSFAGVNSFDTFYRSGKYKVKDFPLVIGFEGCGVVEDVGRNSRFKIGQRVCYPLSFNGAYAEKRAINQNLLIASPAEIHDELIAGSLFKGVAAHCLLFDCVNIRIAKTILVHGATGGINHLLCQWASSLGVKVIGTVGSDDKMDFARSNGCAFVINYEKEDFAKKVLEFTNGKGANVVYDCIGKKTLLKSLDVLAVGGICVSFGDLSGELEKFDIKMLTKRSLYLTRPVIAQHKINKAVLSLSAIEVFDKVSKGILRPFINKYHVNNIGDAHKKMEDRKSMGSNILGF